MLLTSASFPTASVIQKSAACGFQPIWGTLSILSHLLSTVVLPCRQEDLEALLTLAVACHYDCFVVSVVDNLSLSLI